MILIHVDTKIGERKIRNVLKHFDVNEILQAVGNRQLRWIDKNFRAGGIERRWPPLSPRTIARRRLGSSRPLMDTGRLRMSFTRRPHRPSDAIFTRRGTTVTIGTNVEYAVYHEEGRGHLPQRKMLPSKRVAQRLAREVLSAVVKEAARGAG